MLSRAGVVTMQEAGETSTDGGTMVIAMLTVLHRDSAVGPPLIRRHS